MTAGAPLHRSTAAGAARGSSALPPPAAAAARLRHRRPAPALRLRTGAAAAAGAGAEGRSDAAAASIVPNFPFAGDDHAADVYTALSRHDADSAFDAAGNSYDEGDSASSSDAASGSDAEDGKAAAAAANGGPPETIAGVPHRWAVVAMMALSFVLCNMDKVCSSYF
jgi:hypothetical protein